MTKLNKIYIFLLFANCNYCFITNSNMFNYKNNILALKCKNNLDNEIPKINNIYTINRIINFNENNEITNIFSVYKNNVNKNKEIIYAEKKYNENNTKIIEFEILQHTSLKYKKDFNKFVKWLNDNFLRIKKNKNDSKNYNIFSVCLIEKEEQQQEYENMNSLFEDYLLNDYLLYDIEIVHESYKSPFNYDIFSDD